MSDQPIAKEQGSEPAPSRRRVQLDFTPEGFDRLKAIRERSEAQTNAEVVRNALRILEWFLTQRERGNRIQVVEGDQVHEVHLLL